MFSVFLGVGFFLECWWMLWVFLSVADVGRVLGCRKIFSNVLSVSNLFQCCWTFWIFLNVTHVRCLLNLQAIGRCFSLI